MHSSNPAFLAWRAQPSRDTLRGLLLATQDRVYSLCFQVLRHAHDAEDAAQASLLEIARGSGSIKDSQAFSSWMYRVCLNNALTLRRETRRRKHREERRAAMNPTAAAPAADDVRDAVHDALARLDDDNRAIIVEHYFEKATLDDIGSRHGISGPAAWKRIEHAKEKMRRALTGAGLAIGLTQMNSVLEAAEVIPAPSGFSVEGALVSPPRASLAPRVFGAAVVIVAAVITAVFVVPRSSNRSETPTNPTVGSVPLSPAPAPKEDFPEPLPPVPPVQEEPNRVLDPDGNPIQGALVFPGRWYRLRGDDAFDLFRPQSIKDGITTDAEGRFKLETKSPFITAWHAEFTPTTVKTADAPTIRLRARGTIRGRLVGADEKPLEGIEVTLDKRGPKATTDKDGRFEFDKVIAGIRGLILPNNRWIAVRVEPGETLNVDLRPGVNVTLDLSGHPQGAGAKINGALIGTQRTSSLMGVRGTAPTVDLKGVIPGRYFYIEIRRGPRGWVDITEKGAKVEFGASTLEINSQEPVSFYLLPAGCNEVIEVGVMKDGDFKAGPGEPVRVTLLVEGDYEIKDREGLTLETFKVGPGETRITLKK